MDARAIQRTVRQSPRKMRLVIDMIRGLPVPEAYAILRFSKKFAARQIHKVLKSAVANAEQQALRGDRKLDVDHLRVKYAVVNAGPMLKRFTSAAMGRATPILKRTSHVEIHVAEEAPRSAARAAGKGTAAAPSPPAPKKPSRPKATKPKKTAARGAKRKPAKKPGKRKGSK